MIDYSIIIPAYNEEAYLPGALAEVFTAVEGVTGRAEVVVVDNNSTDQTGEIARTMGARVIPEPVNQIARARNAGARAARGRWLIFVDADTLLTAALLGKALENLKSGRIAGGGTMVAPDRPLEPAAQSALDTWNRMSRIFNIAAGCFVYCTKAAFDAVGGFSQRVYASEEIWFSIHMQLWARRHGKRFRVIRDQPVVTSIRKLEWFSPGRLLVSSLVLTLFPPALFSRRLCHVWYHRPGSAEAAISHDTANRSNGR